MKKGIEKKEVKKKPSSVAKKQKPSARVMSPQKGAVKEKSEKNETTGIKKQYLKSDGWCNVTFVLPKDAAPNAKVVTIVGDFNNWSYTDTQMKKLKNGDFKITLKLHKNKEYRFRYLIDSNRWENDWYADSYVPNAFGGEDSIVIV